MISTQGLVVVLFVASLAIAAHADLTITVVAVSESLLADSEFVVPDGYRAMQAPAPLSK